ncbi:hypothetical protein D3C73_881760 [compost metagenome]
MTMLTTGSATSAKRTRSRMACGSFRTSSSNSPSSGAGLDSSCLSNIRFAIGTIGLSSGCRASPDARSDCSTTRHSPRSTRPAKRSGLVMRQEREPIREPVRSCND